MSRVPFSRLRPVEDQGPATIYEADATGRISDERLVLRARAGDRWAEDALFRRYARAIAGLVTRLLGDRIEAEDVVQETFVEALEDLDRLRDPSRVRSWLFGIAVHRVHRRFRRRRLLSILGLDRSAGDATLAALAAPGLEAERHAELALLDRALGRLPAEERIAWMLRVVEGEEMREVAAHIGCSLATAKRRVARAQARITAHVRGGGAR